MSLFDMIVAGGPLMVPIGLCSVVALAYAVERSFGLRAARLAPKQLEREVLAAFESGGARAAAEVCGRHRAPLAGVLAAGLARAGAPWLEVEKAVEDAGAREVRRLQTSLRPLVVVGMIAPLLGLLGTVWGMIQAFSTVATEGALGEPELLAGGISQALVTTAAGLAVAIPAQAVYYWFRGRIDRFVRRLEDAYAALDRRLGHVPPRAAAAAAESDDARETRRGSATVPAGGGAA